MFDISSLGICVLNKGVCDKWGEVGSCGGRMFENGVFLGVVCGWSRPPKFEKMGGRKKFLPGVGIYIYTHYSSLDYEII